MDGQVVSLSIAGLLRDVFGIKTAAFKPDIAPLAPRVENNTLGTAYYGTDQFGREVFLPITFTWQDASNQKQSITLNHAVIGIGLPNSAIYTPLTERSGSFMEIVNEDNNRFTIYGFLIEPTNDFPEEQFKQLVALRKQKIVSLQNAMTDLVLLDKDRLGYDTVFVEDIQFPEVRGKKNVKPYQINIKSYIPFNLEEIQE